MDPKLEDINYMRELLKAIESQCGKKVTKLRATPFFYLKGVLFFVLMWGSWTLWLTDWLPNVMYMWGSWALLLTGWFPTVIYVLLFALGFVGIAVNVMHDANHGSVSKNPILNRILSYSMNMLGNSSHNWRVQHNDLHHNHTNIAGMDDDIEASWLLRLSPYQEYHPIHRFQYLYAWFLYALQSIYWVLYGDFKNHFAYTQKLSKREKNKEFAILIATKLFHIGYMVLIPLIVTDISWWVVLIAALSVHGVVGLSLALIFQTAHVVTKTEMLPEDTPLKAPSNEWFERQMRTTANFAPNSWFASFFTGGLNQQVEHHILRKVCHVHYRDVGKILKQKANEWGLPYNSYDTVIQAVYSHAVMLWRLGRPQLVST